MFGKKGRRSAAIQTLIGSNTLIDGDVRFEGGFHIDGTVNGSIVGGKDSEACLSISEHGRVQGNVNVPILALSGMVEGDVVVSERVELGSTARVNGNVYYNLIEMAAGAEINGKLIHEASSVKAAVTSTRVSADEVLVDAELQGVAKQNG